MTKLSTPTGGKTTDLTSMASRLATAAKVLFSGKLPETSIKDIDVAPFNPGQPITPSYQAEPEDGGMRGRTFDYPTGTNLNYQPRKDEPLARIDAATLRNFADNYDLLRLVIETCKDQICMVPWKIKPKDKKGKEDKRCKEVEDFLAFPDGEHNWQTWLRMVLDDLYVIDAPTVYPRFTRAKKLYSLDVMDGALIKRLINASGRTPTPEEGPAYQQKIKGLPAVDYTRDELIYLPRNLKTYLMYGTSPVEQVIMTVRIAIKRQLYQSQYYEDGNLPDAIFGVPKEWNPDQIRQFEEYFNSILAGNTAERRRAKFVPDGVTYHDVKEKALKDEYDEWLARVICYAFGQAPTPFIKSVNRATSESAAEAAKEQGDGPVLAWVKGLIDLVLWKYFGYTDLEAVCEQAKDVDPQVQAEIDKIYLQEYVISPDEVRDRLGLEGDAPTKPLPPALGQPTTEGGDDPFGGGDGKAKADDKGKPVVKPDDKAKPAAAPDKGTGKDAKADKGSVEKAAISDVTRAVKKKSFAPIDRDRPFVKKARKEFKDTIEEFLIAQSDEVAAQVITAYESFQGALEADKILASIDLNGWVALIDPAKEVLEKVFSDGGVAAFAQIKFAPQESMTDLVNTQAVDYAEQRAAELVGMKNVGTKAEPEWVENPNADWAITDSTREMLRGTVTTATEEGWSAGKLQKEIMDNNAFSASRAEMIARTECGFADTRGNMAAYRASGVVAGKEWLLGSEHDDDDECSENADAGVIPLDAVFPSGDDAPLAHPNCVCSLVVTTIDTHGDDSEE